MAHRSLILSTAVAVSASLGLTACPGPFPWPPGNGGGDGQPPVVVDPEPPHWEVPLDLSLTDVRGTGRAIMMRVRHTPDPQEPHRMTLEKTRVYVRRGDIGPILVSTFRQDGTEIESWRAPDPLEKNGETARLEEARYGVPFSPELFIVSITDTRTGARMDVKVDEVVRNHCVAEPTDNICRDIDLAASAGLDHYDPRVLKVGESMTVPVTVGVRNLGTDWADVDGSMFQFGILDHTTFTTADPTGFDLGVIDPTDSRSMTLAYTLTCTSEGDDRIFVGAEFWDPAREAVDSNPASNRWNTWFDIHCDPADVP